MPRGATNGRFCSLAASGALAVVLAGCGSVSDPRASRPDGGTGERPADGSRGTPAGDAAAPDVPAATINATPALPFWTASGGGSATAPGGQLGISVGGLADPAPLVAPSGARLTLGLFGETTR
jgi:hypothetical protein